MKFCPVCQTRYDEEILRFCINDGTPLVEENPSFTTLPSESSAQEDDGEATIIRRNPPKINPAPDAPPATQRIVIPTVDAPRESVRAKTQTAQIPPRKSNTAVLVVLTMLGTLAVLGALGGVWYLLRGGGNNSNANNANKTIVTNVNVAPANANFYANFNADNSLSNFNANLNANFSINTNANLKTPSPSRTPTPPPTRTPENVNANANTGANLANTNALTRPTVTPTPLPKPSVSPTPLAPPQNVNVGVVNSRATSLPKPAYPQIAKQANASGQVTVQVTIDEQGNVTSARAVSGNALLRPSAEAAARQSRFNPVRVGDRAVTATGLLVYNFINQ